MSWQIPQQIEQDIIAGKAQYRTFQTGVGGQSILPVPSNAYAVIFGYDFSPAGGGITYYDLVGSAQNFGPRPVLDNSVIRFFETQQISFYTGTDFFPFIHHISKQIAASSGVRTEVVPPATSTALNLEAQSNSDHEYQSTYD